MSLALATALRLAMGDGDSAQNRFISHVTNAVRLGHNAAVQRSDLREAAAFQSQFPDLIDDFQPSPNAP
jgi:hypothetical protein